jgi:DNA-binding GntR family transcriptional regulator
VAPIDRTAYPRFKRVVSVRELAEAFTPVADEDEITVRMPTPEETELLKLPPGTPVGEIVRIGYGKDDRPVRVMVTIAPGDRHLLVYDQDV